MITFENHVPRKMSEQEIIEWKDQQRIKRIEFFEKHRGKHYCPKCREWFPVSEFTDISRCSYTTCNKHPNQRHCIYCKKWLDKSCFHKNGIDPLFKEQKYRGICKQCTKEFKNKRYGIKVQNVRGVKNA